MAKHVKKPDIPDPHGKVHKAQNLPDDLLRFSFRHYTISKKFCLPAKGEKAEYLATLLDRLRHVSGMRVSEFRAAGGHALRSHSHAWPDTTEPKGYSHLSKQLQQCDPWQFSLSANEYGRVHGILVDDVFYVVWLDHDHKLYPKK